MSTFPKQLADRAAHMIAQTARLTQVAHQRLNTLSSQLTPGPWNTVTGTGGWAAVPGYVPYQVRLLQQGVAQLTGHIQGGSTAANTVIGTLPAGLFNANHSHIFTVNVTSGAGSVANPVSQGTLVDGTVSTGVMPAIPVGEHIFTGTVSGALCTMEFGPGIGQQFGPVNISSQSLNNTNLNSNQTTSLNMNTPTLTLNTSGQLVLSNCPPAATQLSFHELLPLLT